MSPDFLSLQSQRARSYLSAAVALLSVIPLLACVVVMLSIFTDLLPASELLRMGAGTAGGLAGLSGYLMLRVYPANQARLKAYLEQMASEKLPEHAELIPGELDTRDLEFFLNRVIGSLQEKVHQLDEALQRSQEMLATIETQSEEIISAERQRVMIESLGAACHHIGQPTTVLSLYLTRLRDMHPDEFEKQDLAPCLHAVEDITTILRKLKQVSEYRTIPYGNYRGKGAVGDSEPGSKILDIESDQQTTA